MVGTDGGAGSGGAGPCHHSLSSCAGVTSSWNVIVASLWHVNIIAHHCHLLGMPPGCVVVVLCCCLCTVLLFLLSCLVSQ